MSQSGTSDGLRAVPRGGLIHFADPVARVVLSTLVILIGVVLAIRPGIAGVTQSPTGKVRMSEVESGALLLKTDRPGVYTRAPTVKTDVRMEVSGLVARVVVSQAFTNPSKTWAEAVYVFPLPANAAVDRLRMRIGDRFIEGKIKERAEARKIYEAARAAGKKTALMEQERPNIFTNSVANIGPGETILVQIEYQQVLRYDQGAFALRFPMVVGPRYIPSGAKVVAFNGTGWGSNTRTVPDAKRITPPVLHPSQGKVNPVSLQIKLNAGFPLAWVKSATHKIKVTDGEAGTKTITFDAKTTFAEKDFVLRWLPQTGKAPGAGLFTQELNGKTYALLMVMPPHLKAENIKRLPREVVFVVDTSGSMGGTSIVQAKAALKLALSRLKSGDRFNVIEFNSHARALFNGSRTVDAYTVRRAQAFVSGLKATGGTEMLKALRIALNGQRDDKRLRQVIFITDGSIGNEAQLFRFIRANLGNTRLFTVGIGSAPNSHFMTKAAQFGRGTFTYISRTAEVKARMAELYAKIEEPVLTDIRVTFDRSTGAEAWPRKLPDLYRGEPVIVAARLDKLDGHVTIEGRYAGKAWTLKLPFAKGQAGKGIGALWARSKVAALMDSLHEGADRREVKSEVIKVALAHNLVSKFTSLVAVDVTPARAKGTPLDTHAVPVNLPEGWNFEKVFGPQTRQRKADRDTRRTAVPMAPSVVRSEKEHDAKAQRLAQPRKMVARGRGAYASSLPPTPPAASPTPKTSTGSAPKPDKGPVIARVDEEKSRTLRKSEATVKQPVDRTAKQTAKDKSKPVQQAQGVGGSKPAGANATGATVSQTSAAGTAAKGLWLLIGLLLLVVVPPILVGAHRR